MNLFDEMFQEAAKSSARFSSRQRFFDELQKYAEKLSPEQTYIRDMRQADLHFDKAEYQNTRELCEKILKTDITPEQQIETRILLGNARIRLGNVQESIDDFSKAVKMSRANEFMGKLSKILKLLRQRHFHEVFKLRSPKVFWKRILSELIYHPFRTLSLLGVARIQIAGEEYSKFAVWRIRALNELGWAYRLLGDLARAEFYYSEAERKYLREDEVAREESERRELRTEYGWVLNNQAFILSEDVETREQAMGMARDAIQHWQTIGDDIGLGAAYLVLGNAQYRDGRLSSALDAYQNALEIFEPLNHQDWLARIYSWRGILYLTQQAREPENHKLLDDAANDLKKSLEIGSQDVQAMTLNRLGRVYMRRENWQEAEKYIQESFQLAQEIPDYRYWLASLARLFSIAAKQGQFQKLQEYHQLLKKSPKLTQKFYKYDLGLGYFGLANLAFVKNDPDEIPLIIAFVKQGISLLAESPFYAHGNINRRLELIEKDFHNINSEIIRSVGQALQEYCHKNSAKSKKSPKSRTYYNSVAKIMYTWANWGKKS